MRVLHIHDKLLPAGDGAIEHGSERVGGTAMYIGSVVSAQRDAGMEVATVRLCEHPRVGRGINGAPDIELRASGLRNRSSLTAQLGRAVAEFQPEIIHLHSAFYAIHSAALDALCSRVPVICTMHDVTPICFRRTKVHSDGRVCVRAAGLTCVTSGCYQLGSMTSLARDIVQIGGHSRRIASYRRLPLTIVGSGYMRDALAANGFRPDALRVIPLFSRFAPEAAPQPGDPVTIAFVGRLTAEKGILQLIGALANLRDLEWRTVIVGEGPLEEEAHSRAAGAGILDRVRFMRDASGEALASVYRRASFIVFPSTIAESFGLVGVEAMSFGRPVVGFRVGGVTEWLEDGVTGFAAPHGDESAFTTAIARLIGDRLLRERMGQSALDAVRRRFTVDAHMRALHRAYDDAIHTSAKAVAS